jgi:hypothetical protein
VRRSFWLGFAAYLVPSFPIGYFWHLVTFADQYHALDMYRDQVVIPMGLASMIIQAFFFSWAYPKLFSTQHPDWIKSALASTVVFTVLSWSFTTLPVAAKYKMTSISDFMMLETGFTLLQFAVVAPLIALAHRQKR